MIFDVIGVVDFLRARYGDRLIEDLVASNVRTAPDEFVIIELKWALRLLGEYRFRMLKPYFRAPKED